MTPVIRNATPKDIKNLLPLLKTLFSIEKDFTFDSSLQKQGLEMLLTDNRYIIKVATAESRIVGMVSGQLIISTAEGGHSLLIEDLVVHEQYRKQGIGASLLAELCSWAENSGATRFQLLADKDNSNGLAFYKKTGWQQTNLIALRRTEKQK